MLGDVMLPGIKLFKKGKVRNVYDLGNELLLIATDRISCFDVILSDSIPDKGRILTGISIFWFSYLSDIVKNHLISSDIMSLPSSLSEYGEYLKGRFMITKKCRVIPFECVVRGYISGSGWKEYKQNGRICGIKLPADLKESDKLSEPIFTPATKASVGHDENVSFQTMKESLGVEVSTKVKDLSIALYTKAADLARSKGIIIADTKFEFGFCDNQLLLIDEVLTPDSSRFWPKEDYAPGRPQASFDKQFVRDYLETLDWAKTPPAPRLPREIIEKTQDKYKKAYKIITGKDFI